MLDLTKIKNVYLFTRMIDMRIGMNKIQTQLSFSFTPEQIIYSLFIFVSKDRKSIKIYFEDEYGKWLLINKLSYSIFRVPDVNQSITITKDDLKLLLKGVAMLEERKKEVAI